MSGAPGTSGGTHARKAPEPGTAPALLPGIALPVPKPPARISPFRWALWWGEIGLALVIFYGIFSVGWIGLRLVARVVERRSRKRKG